MIMGVYILFLLYVLGVLFLLCFDKKQFWKTSIKKLKKSRSMSVLVVFRNEAQRILNLLESIKTQDYPKESVEWVFIDDYSNDETTSIIQDKLDDLGIDYQVVKGIHQGKKQGIIQGVNVAKFDYIITSDADCTLPKNWLNAYNLAFETSDFVLGRVLIKNENLNFWAKLKAIEQSILSFILNISLQLKRPILSSGANLGYLKSLFLELNPYRDNLDVASGDDMFLLKTINQKNINVGLLSLPVYTISPQGLNAVLNQSARWVGKGFKLGDFWVLLSYGMVFFFGVMIYFLLIFCPFVWWCFVLKIMVDIWFVKYAVSRQLNSFSVNLIVQCYLVFPFYIMGVFIKLFAKSSWKERFIK